MKKKSERKDIEYRDVIDSRLRYRFDKEREWLNEKEYHRLYKIRNSEFYRKHFSVW